MVFPTDSPWKDNLLSLPRLSFQYSDVCPTTTSTPPSHSSCQVLVHVDSLAIASHIPSEGTSTDFVSGASTISLLTDRCYNRAGYWPDTSFDVLLLSCDVIMGIVNTVDGQYHRCSEGSSSTDEILFTDGEFIPRPHQL